MRGRVAWITGGSSGIGAAVARELAQRGATVAVTARSADDLDDVVDGAGGAVVAYPADVRDREQLSGVAAAIEERFGPLDIVMMNAGAWQQMDVAEWDSTAIREHVDTNLLGMVNTLDAVLPNMLARGRGRLVGVASVAGYRGFTGAEAYGSTKAAEINLLESLRIDLARFGVAVQIVNPGFVDTAMTRRNDFPMPFMTDTGTAGRRIVDAIRKGKAETVFPFPYLVGMKLLRLAPVRPYTAVSGWLAKRSAEASA
jgi:NAD(P)-dependent dehydrogenase (short-subunit alcohol dehydrogenase family)